MTPQFIEVTSHITDQRVLVSTREIKSVIPKDGYVALYIIDYLDKEPCWKVKESYEEIKKLLRME